MRQLASLLLLVLLAACSPQQRLTHLLAAHPELQVVDTVVVHHSFVTPADTATTTASFDSLMAVIDAAIQENHTNRAPFLQAHTTRSTAALTIDTAGNLTLSAIDSPDTLHFVDTCFVQVPPKITYVDRTIYRMMPAQRTAMAIAWTFIAAQLLFLILRLIRKFIV